jgi:uncharacterized membrane protein YhhN
VNNSQILKQTSRLLFGTPLLICALALVGGVLSLLNLRDENIAYSVGMLACFLVSFVACHYALGRAASLLGKSWLIHGLLPLLVIPIGQLIAWLNLVDARSKLEKSVTANKGESASA